MKKLFLLALTLLLVCNAVFASEDPVPAAATAKATLYLDLGGKSSIAHVGFRSSLVEPTAIDTKTEGNLSDIRLIDVDNTDKVTTKEFVTDSKSFYIFWYLHSLKGDTAASVSFSFSRFADANSTEFVGYDLTISDVKTDGTLQNVTVVSDGADSSVAATASESTDVSIVKTNDASTGGLHRGCLMVTINPIEYDNVSAQDYTASLALTIMAP